MDFPMARPAGCPFDLPPDYRRLRAEEPITRARLSFDETEVWLVTNHELARAVLGNENFASDFSRPGFPRRMTTKPPGPGTLIRIDPPDHTRIRAAVADEFKPRRVAQLRPAIQRIVDGLIDELLTREQPIDLIEEYALPLPSLFLCELLGVPYDDREFFHSRIRVIGGQDTTLEERTRVRTDLSGYLDGLVTTREKEPTEDLVSRLVQRHREVGDISREEVVGLATLLLIAGYETLANQIGLAVAILLHHPEQLSAIRDDPSKLGGAIEELLRHQTIVHYGVRRAAIADTVIGGQLIKAGEGVIVAADSANRDSTVFADPEIFDITRDANGHLAFGYGIHQCIGQRLARVELEVALGTLIGRMPKLQLAAPLDEVPFREKMFVYGVQHLPVTF